MRQSCLAIFAALCLEALFSVGYRGTFLLTQSYPLAWAAAAVSLLCGALGYLYRERLLRSLSSLFPEQAIATRGWFWAWLMIGLVLRIVWVLVFPTPLLSDGLAYFASATRMVQHTYTAAYWPPGLPLVLAPMMHVFGIHTWVTILLCLLLYVATHCVTWSLSRYLADARVAGIAIAVLAVWPGYVTIGGTNCKEALTALLIPAAMLLYARAVENTHVRWLLLASSGALAGYCALTQPGYLLFAALIFLLEVLRRATVFQAITRAILFGLAMLVVILPWTWRNYRVTHRPILITVNGGSAFYLANNPNANAAYEDEGAIRLPTDHYEADRIGYREGKRWIAEHPLSFLKLVVRKQVVFFGDDGTGVYETLKRDREPSRALYGGLKAVTSIFWLGFWVLMSAGLVRFARMEVWGWFGLCMLPVLYQWTIDSVFISASRHHLSYVASFSILAALVLVMDREQREKPLNT